MISLFIRYEYSYDNREYLLVNTNRISCEDKILKFKNEHKLFFKLTKYLENNICNII